MWTIHDAQEDGWSECRDYRQYEVVDPIATYTDSVAIDASSGEISFAIKELTPVDTTFNIVFKVKIVDDVKGLIDELDVTFEVVVQPCIPYAETDARDFPDPTMSNISIQLRQNDRTLYGPSYSRNT